MGTRGLFGVFVNGKSKLMYNHFDSYPECLGIKVLRDVKSLLQEKGLVWMKKRAEELNQINQYSTPTEKQIQELEPYTDLGVSDRSVYDWYCLFRHLQGELAEVFKIGYILDSPNFIRDSLFCEWCYVLNLDGDKLEVYVGFQKKPHNLGRYSNELLMEYPNGIQPYYPCALLLEFPLDKLPDDEQFLKLVNEADEKSKQNDSI